MGRTRPVPNTPAAEATIASRDLVRTSRDLIEAARRTIATSRRLCARHVAQGLFDPPACGAAATPDHEGDTMTSISITRHAAGDGTLRLSPIGEIDMASSGQLATAIRDAITTGHITALVIDLDQVTFLDSSGIAALIAGHHLATAHGIGYQITNPHGMVQRTLDITGVLPALTDQDVTR